MNEAQRQARNKEKLAECYPAFRARLTRTLWLLEGTGQRPRIQEAYRSPAAQQRAYEAGTSTLRYGLHNATSRDGAPEALAADVLDERAPTSPSKAYLLRLAIAAADAGLETGILWGLTATQRERTRAAIRARDFNANVPIGWDPTHVQVVGLTGSQVRAGARPPAYSWTRPAPQPAPQPVTPAPQPDNEEEAVRLHLVKIEGDSRVYLVAPGKKPIHIRDQAALASLRKLWPDLGAVQVISSTALSTLSDWE